MRFKHLSLLIFLFFTLHFYSQKEANFWFFGENAGLDFSTSPPTAITGSLNTFEGSASISDANGKLQFYTDGSTVYDKNGNIMPNGTDLDGNPSSSQSALIVPKPLDPNIYYIFTVDAFSNTGNTQGAKFSIVDISLNSGLGEVTTKNSVLNRAEFAGEKITAVAGKDCNTFWIITSDTSNFYSYKIDNSGVVLDPIISNHFSFSEGSELRGYLKVSPNGKYLVSASQGGNLTFLYDFDNSTGNISSERALDIPNLGYGVEFSRDSKQLYISTGRTIQGSRPTPGFATIEKFNLDANNDNVTDEITDINSSKIEIYNTNSGYRGALQLASNGKIYYARPNVVALGVINNPESLDPVDIDFEINGVNLGSNRSSEGLPPFIQSFFLPINVVDNSGEIISNKEVQYCTGETITFTPEQLQGVSSLTYTWTFDNGTTVSSLTSNADGSITLNGITTANAGKYNLEIQLTDVCGRPLEYNATFDVLVFEAATATKPEDIFFCDVDGDGFNEFNLNSLKDNEILNGLDTATFEVIYYNTRENAEGNIAGTSLSNPYRNTNSFSNETIFARVQNKSAPDACFAVTEFALAVTELPVPNSPTPYKLCDDDTDMTVNTFVLNTKDDEIYGSLDKTRYVITYHTTKEGATNRDTSTIIDSNSNYTVTDKQTVYVRIENIDNPDCANSVEELELEVIPFPTLISAPASLDQCISINNPNPTVNLTTAEPQITNDTNVRFEYYSNINANPQDLISNPGSFPVNPNNSPYNLFVKVIETSSGIDCANVVKELTVNVNVTPESTAIPLQAEEPDDLIDPNSGNTTPVFNSNFDSDRSTIFRLNKTAIENSIRQSAANTNTKILYFENITDRANEVNEIDITEFRNNVAKNDITQFNGYIEFPIYYKVVNNNDNSCQAIGFFNVRIYEVPTVNNVGNIEQCDDAASGNSTDGRNTNINLRSIENDIFTGTNQSSNDFEVSYYTSQTDAYNGNTSSSSYITNPDQYTNNAPSGFTQGDIVNQTIFVRVENKNTPNAVNANMSFNIIIYPAPALPTSVTDLIACDTDTDPRNRVTQNIDLRAKESEILMGRSNLDITYFISQQDAESNTNPITNPSNYQNSTDPNITSFPSDFNGDDPAIQTIFYVISDQSGLQCSSSFATFRVLIYPEPFVNPITVLSECDNNDDGDDTNGIIQTIDLNGKIPEILGPNRNSNDYQVTFYSSQSDAIAGLPSTALASPYTNSNRTETIHVRVQQNNSACFNAKQSFNLEINSLPDFSVTTPQILCLNDLPLTIEVENPGDVYAYQWKDSSGNVLGANASLDVNQAGIYTVVATDNVTFCTREETIQINQSNVATLDASFVTIVDESNNLSNQSNLSISIDTINNNLGPGDYQFAILNTDTNTRTPFIGYQDEPLFQNLEGGIYQIIVNDKNGCTPDTTLLVSVVQFPKFFTPNGDGQNDTWEVKGANKTFYPNSSITIFNRYGKLVAQFDIDDTGWNGTYNGTQLPSDDYWYNITLVPSDNSKPTINKKGNFSLLRR